MLAAISMFGGFEAADAVPITGLAAEYLFSGNAADTSGHALHGTVNGAALTTDRFGAANSAYLFNGSGAHIEIGDVEIVSGNAMSVSAWFRTTSTLPYAKALVSKLYSGVAYHLGGSLAGGNRLQFLINSTSSGDYRADSNGALNDGAWHHIVGVYDGTLPSANIKLYVDDVLQADVGTLTAAVNSSTAEILTIGATQNGGGGLSDFWDGSIDEVRIYDRALAAAEVTELFEGAAVPEPGSAALLALALALAASRLWRNPPLVFAAAGITMP